MSQRVFVWDLRLRRVAAGSYETEDGRYAIVETEWTGPRGGRRTLWEIADVEHDRHTVGRHPPGDTLREARENLADLVAP